MMLTPQSNSSWVEASRVEIEYRGYEGDLLQCASDGRA